MEPIAIIGLACRFPAAPSAAAFWQMLCEGANGIGPVPPTRWDIDAYFDEDPKAPGKTNSRYGGFIDNIDGFDADFFGISPREALQMDPQQRILLEVSHEALEDAGIPPSSLRGSDTAVYIGAISNDYQRLQGADSYTRVDVHSGGGAGFAMLANRLSYQFDLNGPSMAIDSACSSSLVAVYQACQALWTGQSGLALAGGVNLILDPGCSIFYTKGGLLAPDGRCKTFAADANGIGRGEGAGLVVLKPYGDARRDGDPIYALIKGGAVLHDGRGNGLTAPNRWGQEKVLRRAWQHADISGDQLEYVELHGTGTYIGDPIEANALGNQLAKTGLDRSCLVGSVKTNIGHLEAAAGIAGLIKLALSIYHRSLVPSLWFSNPNPVIDFTRLPIQVNTEHQPWPGSEDRDRPLLAGINSFGLGGTNAHLVLQSAPSPAPAAAEPLADSPLLLVLSANTAKALRCQATVFSDLLSREVDAAALCMTAMARKDLHPHRLNILGENRDELHHELTCFLQGRPGRRTLTGICKPSKQQFLLIMLPAAMPDPGRVGQWLAQAPIGRQAWADCRQLLLAGGKRGLPPLAQLAASPLPTDPLTQSLWCFAAQYAMAVQILAALPIVPTLVASGLAQLAACCVSGAISLADALAWLQRGLDHKAPPTSAYTSPCLCPSGRNPRLADLQWRSDHHQWQQQLIDQDDRKVTRLIVTIDAAPFPLPALPCLGQDKNDYGYFFSRLSLLCRLRFAAVADRRFIRLPAYPWQRQSYWLPPPTAAIPPLLGAMAAVTANRIVDENVRPQGALNYRLCGLTEDDQHQLLRTYLAEAIGKALQLPPAGIDPDQPINTMGIDSLTAVEIKNSLARDAQVTIPITKFLDGFTLNDLVSWVFTQLNDAKIAPSSLSLEVSVPAGLTAAKSADDINSKVSGMSMAEVEELLQQLGSGSH